MKRISITNIYAEALDTLPQLSKAFDPYPHLDGKDKCVCYMDMITKSIQAFDNETNDARRQEIAVALLGSFLSIAALGIRGEISTDTSMTLCLWAQHIVVDHELLCDIFSISAIPSDFSQDLADAMIAEDMHRIMDAEIASIKNNLSNNTIPPVHLN